MSRRTKTTSVRDVYGPVRPRLDRIRTKRWALLHGSAGNFTQLINNPMPAHIAANNPVYNGNVNGYMWTKDTIPNKLFNHRYPLKDNGGQFLSRASWWSHSCCRVDFPWQYHTRMFGTLWANTPNVYHDGMFIKDTNYPPTGDYTDVPGYGPTGWARAKPDRPILNYGQSLVELRDLPRMLQERVADIKDITSYYVGLEFGWSPLLADIKHMLKLAERLDRIYRSILRNNGLAVRRRATILRSNDSINLQKHPGSMGIVINTKAVSGLDASRYGQPFYNVDFQKTRHIWFSGSFIDWVDDVATPEGELRIKASLLGFQITPKLVWDLIPWSWLVDWFSNTGDILSNISSTWADREVSEYAYVMGETHRHYTWTGSDGLYQASSTKHFSTKCRYYADRFGLQSTSALSATQTAILIALGLLRVGV